MLIPRLLRLFRGAAVFTSGSALVVLYARAESPKAKPGAPAEPFRSRPGQTNFPNLFSRCIQWQMDANVCVVHQILREYESTLHLLTRLLNLHAELLEHYSPNSNPDIDDQLVLVRSEWNKALLYLDRIELCFQSSMKTLNTAVETAFICDDLVKPEISSDASEPTNFSLSCQGSETIHACEVEFMRLSEKRRLHADQWSKLISENITKWKSDEDHKK